MPQLAERPLHAGDKGALAALKGLGDETAAGGQGLGGELERRLAQPGRAQSIRRRFPSPAPPCR